MRLAYDADDVADAAVADDVADAAADDDAVADADAAADAVIVAVGVAVDVAVVVGGAIVVVVWVNSVLCATLRPAGNAPRRAPYSTRAEASKAAPTPRPEMIGQEQEYGKVGAI